MSQPASILPTRSMSHLLIEYARTPAECWYTYVIESAQGQLRIPLAGGAGPGVELDDLLAMAEHMIATPADPMGPEAESARHYIRAARAAMHLAECRARAGWVPGLPRDDVRP